MCIRDSTLIMAVDDTAETSVFAENNGPRPNSPGKNFNNIDSGRVSLRSTLRHLYGEEVLKKIFFVISNDFCETLINNFNQPPFKKFLR